MSILPYQLEPEYSSSEEIEDQSNDSGEEETDVLVASSAENRVTDTSWCLCDRCAIMPTEKECVCCKNSHFCPRYRKVCFNFDF